MSVCSARTGTGAPTRVAAKRTPSDHVRRRIAGARHREILSFPWFHDTGESRAAIHLRCRRSSAVLNGHCSNAALPEKSSADSSSIPTKGRQMFTITGVFGP
jgi:hypothetical protein